MPNINPNTNPEWERMGATLREYRQINDVSVQDLANNLGISYSYLANIEAGRKRLTPGLATKAAAFFKIPRIVLVRADYTDTAVAS